jgi:hypothetical protein
VVYHTEKVGIWIYTPDQTGRGRSKKHRSVEKKLDMVELTIKV